MTRRRILIAAALLLVVSAAAAPRGGYDILITGGRVLDGAGNPWVEATIAIAGDRIARIGRFTAPAARVIDATGLYVAPGFIDMMDQSGAALRRDGGAESKVRQGVTTAIAGEGGTPAPPAELDAYFETLQKQGISLNFGTYVSAAQARTAVLRSEDREPTPEELERMKAFVEEAMRRGALGLTTALIYQPGSYAKTPELIELAKVAARYGGVYATHLRDEGRDVLGALGEAIEIGERGRLPVEIFHLKVADRQGWRKTMPRIDALVRAARARGVQVTADQYPYTASGTGLDACLPGWLAEGSLEQRNKRLNDPTLRRRIVNEIGRSSRVQGFGRWTNVVISAMPAGGEARYVGMTIDAIARERRQAPEETVIDLVGRSTARIGAIYFMMDEQDVRTAMTFPWVSVGSDAGIASIDDRQSRPHPRVFGTFPRVIARYVREAKVLTLENAVRRMTSLPAATLHLGGRGVLTEGAFADIVVFDYDRIEDTATYAAPQQYPKGIPYVLVNGQVVVDEGRHTGARPGRVIYGPGRQAP